jgi:microcystin-dependent protein
MARVLLSNSTVTGEVKMFAGSSAPEGYLLCQGQAISRTTYASLFTILGTTYGSGDGSTTFNLPDYRGQFLRGEVDITTVTGSGTASSNNATFTAHGINRTGFKVRLSSGTLSGLSTLTDYYAIVVDSNTLAFATTKANAIAGTKVAISGANSAVIIQQEDPDKGSRVSKTQEDAMQGHNHYVPYSSATGSGAYMGRLETNPTADRNMTATAPITDGVNGTPRTSSESRPRNTTINFIIKT